MAKKEKKELDLIDFIMMGYSIKEAEEIYTAYKKLKSETEKLRFLRTLIG